MKSSKETRLDQKLLFEMVQRFRLRAAGPKAREVIQHQFRKELDGLNPRKHRAAETLAKFIQAHWNLTLSEIQASSRTRGMKAAISRLQSEWTPERRSAESQIAEQITPLLFSEVPDVIGTDLDDWLWHRDDSLKVWRHQIKDQVEVLLAIFELGISEEAETFVKAKRREETENIAKANRPLEDELRRLLPETKQDDGARQQFLELLQTSDLDSTRIVYWRKQLSQELF